MSSAEPRRLPQSHAPQAFNVLVDYTDIFQSFYEALASYAPSETATSECFEERVAELTCDDIVAMAMQALGDMICHGTQYLGSGVSYSDVARLMRQQSVRESLWPQDAADSIYRHQPTPTEQYHLDLMEDCVSDAIGAMFQGCLRNTTEAVTDATLWRVVLAIVLETAKAIESAGRALELSENTLLSYQIDSPFPAKDKQGRVGDGYIYVLPMRGP